MARALARGWGEPVLCSDVDAARAQALAEELGGEALATNAEVAQRADLVVLCHKPEQLERSRPRSAPTRKAVVSLLGGDAARRAARRPTRAPGRTGCMPNNAVEIRQRRRSCLARRRRAATATLDAACASCSSASAGRRARPRRCSTSRRALMASRPRTSRWSPRRRSTPACAAACRAESAARLVVADDGRHRRAAAAARDMDTLARAPRGHLARRLTARGLAALERGGVRAAFSDALDAVLGGGDDAALARRPRARRRRLRRALILVYTILIFVYIRRARCSSRSAGAAAVHRAGRTRCSASCARSASPTCAIFRRVHPADRPARPQPDGRDPRAAIVGRHRRRA